MVAIKVNHFLAIVRVLLIPPQKAVSQIQSLGNQSDCLKQYHTPFWTNSFFSRKTTFAHAGNPNLDIV